ncbi:unnamed protein product [Adineta ricciae]|uniref:TH1 domain-containing protein n=1 Tax=Adineta ricciae TaxID=249248 RepID=A0A815JAR0_ADIRI|nr:unnamed protein product [Adineta ricciae]CAF1376887.1 unnamed protein product [Adineta ricciae]
MEASCKPNVDGDFKTIRNMWSFKAQEQNKLSGSAVKPSRAWCRQEKKETSSSKANVPTVKITNDMAREEPSDYVISPFEPELPSIGDDFLLSLPLPPPPAPIMFRHHAQMVTTLKGSIKKMTPEEKKNVLAKVRKITGLHRWNITRHVFRSGLALNLNRRSSDSIIPLLIRTHRANHLSRADSSESTYSENPFEKLVDYLSCDREEKETRPKQAKQIKRSNSDAVDCMERNRLDEMITQYTLILKHLKNYDIFMTQHPATSSVQAVQRGKSLDNEINSPAAARKEELFKKTISSHRQTQSLSRDFGRTFANFVMNDLHYNQAAKSIVEERKCSEFSDALCQTEEIHPPDEPEPEERSADLAEAAQSPELIETNPVSNDEEANQVLNELDKVLEHQSSSPPTIEDSYVVAQPSTSHSNAQTDKPLMQYLFEGKKTAYHPDHLTMKSVRLPDQMLPVFDIAKKKCFFDTEKPLYTTMVQKIQRRSSSLHLRIFCVTTERIYYITKKNPYPKEVLLFRQILGITCSPYKDGFVCIHSKESHGDRGDWLMLTDYPCELVTRIFMAMGRKSNTDLFLKFQTDFTYCRRFSGEAASSDCPVEIRSAPVFSLKRTNFDILVINTP